MSERRLASQPSTGRLDRPGRNAGITLGFARYWHAATALVAAASVLTELVLVADGHNPLLSSTVPPAPTRVLRFLSYFTIQSNLLVAGTAALLVLAPLRDGPVFRVLRLDALLGITVTGVVYAALLAPLHDPHRITAVTNAGLHYAAPIMSVAGWALFGPRPRVGENTLLLALVWPALYIGWTLVHGAASSWYPYPFIDVADLGYPTALRNGVGMVVLLAGVATLYRVGDARLPAIRPAV
jgi:hypothetical protein